MAAGVLCASLACLGLLLLGLEDVQSQIKLGGPYMLDLKSIENCENCGTKDIDFVVKKNKISKYVYSYSFNWTLNVPFVDSRGLTANINMCKWGSGGWGLNAYKHLSTTPCGDAMKHGPKYFKAFLEGSGLEAACPVRPGSYSVRNLVFNGKIQDLDELPYGKYKLDVTYKNGLQVLGCWRIYVDINQSVK